MQTNQDRQGDALQQIIARWLIPVNSKIGIAEGCDEGNGRMRTDDRVGAGCRRAAVVRVAGSYLLSGLAFGVFAVGCRAAEWEACATWCLNMVPEHGA